MPDFLIAAAQAILPGTLFVTVVAGAGFVIGKITSLGEPQTPSPN